MKKIIAFIVIIIAGFVLVGCTSNDNNESSTSGALIDQTPDEQRAPEKFSGEEGVELSMIDNMIEIETKTVSDGKAHFFNTKISDGTTIYFFIVSDKNGVLRAAANACQVCYASRQGFEQKGNDMVCKTCGNKYPLEKIATEKGGCNPGPINPNLKDEGGIITITEKELMEVANLF